MHPVGFHSTTILHVAPVPVTGGSQLPLPTPTPRGGAGQMKEARLPCTHSKGRSWAAYIEGMGSATRMCSGELAQSEVYQLVYIRFTSNT